MSNLPSEIPHPKFEIRNSQSAIRNPQSEIPFRPSRFSVTLTILLLAALLFPFLWKPWIHGNDGARHYAYCRSLCMDHDLDFTNEFEHYARAGELQEIRVDARTGRPGNSQGIGSGLLWTPFFLAGHLVAWISGAPTDGYSAPYVGMVCFGTTFYAILGLVLLTRVISWRFGSRAALVAVLAIWLGTPLAFYMYLHPSMSHGCSFFLAALLLWEYERWRKTPRAWHFLAMGLTAGLAVATRVNDGLLLLIPAAFWLRISCGLRIGDCGLEKREIEDESPQSAIRNPQSENPQSAIRNPQSLPAAYGLQPTAYSLFTTGFLALAGCLIGFFPQMLAWHAFYGAWLAGPRDYELARNLSLLSSPHFLEVLFSGWRGLFVWSPVLLPAFVGLAILARRRRLLDFVWLAAFLLQTWVIGGWATWYGGASFGQRFFINLLPGFALGLAWLFLRLRPGAPRKILIGAVVLAVLWNGGLAVQYAGNLISRENRVTLTEITCNQFSKAPRWVLEHLRLLRPRDRIQKRL